MGDLRMTHRNTTESHSACYPHMHSHAGCNQPTTTLININFFPVRSRSDSSIIFLSLRMIPPCRQYFDLPHRIYIGLDSFSTFPESYAARRASRKQPHQHVTLSRFDHLKGHESYGI